MRYKIGDRVRIKSIDWYNRYTNGTEVDCGAYPFTSDMKEFCGQERIIANVCQECYLLLGIDDRFVWTDEMIEGLSEEIDYREFVALVRRMREAQKDVIYKSMFSALDSARPTAYEVAKTKQIILEQEVDEYLKKMEE